MGAKEMPCHCECRLQIRMTWRVRSLSPSQEGGEREQLVAVGLSGFPGHSLTGFWRDIGKIIGVASGRAGDEVQSEPEFVEKPSVAI